MLPAVALAVAIPAGAAPATDKARDELRVLQAEVRKAGREYDRAFWRLDEAHVREARVEKRLENTTEELKHARRVLGERVGAMYRNQGPGLIAVLLASEDFSDLVSRMQFFQRIGTADAAAIEEVAALQARLERERRELERETDSRRDAARRLRSERDRLEERLSSKQAEYDRLMRKARASSVSRGAARGPAGPNGMVFPVQGPHYYSDTWGASRSGGRRRHQGTDIMAPAGTPCVAVLSGSVSARASGLGGLSIHLTADNGWRFYYAHLSRYAVTSGRVSAGQTIGYVGSTGNASRGAPHLHFEIHPNGGAPVNPYPYLRAMQ